MLKKPFILLLMTFFALLPSCTVGPNYSRPETVVDDIDSFMNAPQQTHADTLADDIDPWWTHFGDPLTTDLVRQALKNNNSLKAAAANVLQSKALLDQSHGSRLPDITVSGSRAATKNSSPPIIKKGRRIVSHSTAYAADASVSYIVDFFGKLKRTEQAAVADYLSAQATREALTHAVIAQVVKARVQIAKSQRLLNIARETTQNRRDALKIIERRYNSGLTSPLDVYLAKENLAASRSLEPQLEQTLILAQHSLDVLLGQRPDGSKLLPETLPELPDLEPIPMGLPAALLDRRPDVRSAELNLAAATERIGVSIAALYPDLTLTASGGYRSERLSKLTIADADVYSVIMSLSAPIWRGGQLRAQVDYSKAAAQQATADYADTVLVALREVEDSLVKQQKLQERYELLKKRLDEAIRSENLARQRYLRGVEGILVVLDTERSRRTAENLVVETASDLFDARVDMFLALGGDWDETETDSENYQNANINMSDTSNPGAADG
ncbi:MAG: efflux transporter outer membrane subunit [Sedimentisphaerales bacterium]|nr:efflux transporter outer membrane subunit [Sedimentisphaerales bacterium]